MFNYQKNFEIPDEAACYDKLLDLVVQFLEFSINNFIKFMFQILYLHQSFTNRIFKQFLTIIIPTSTPYSFEKPHP